MHPRQIRKVFFFQAQALVTVEDCPPYSHLLQTAIYQPLASLATRWSHCWEVCWEPESLVAVTSQAELWEPMRSPTSQLFHPSFLYWRSTLQWRDLARYAALVPQFPSLGPKTCPLAEVTLSGSLPAICLPIHPATAPMGWDSAGNKSIAQKPWLLQDFGSPSGHFPLLTLLPEGTDGCLDQILACIIYWAHLTTFSRASLASQVCSPACLFPPADAAKMLMTITVINDS